MPDGLTIDKGLEPSHLDDDVRFRTTYYFRVFDVCPIKTPFGPEHQDTASAFVSRIENK